MDEIDKKLIKVLQGQGRLSLAELAQNVGLSSPATGERLRKMEQQGIIQGYTVITNPTALDLRLLAYIAVTVASPNEEAFLAAIVKQTEVLECHHVAGEDSYLLKVRCQDTSHLEMLISNTIKKLPGIIRTRTTIVLSTNKETRDLL
jgi:Lrp/AsnC family leucine-responsive transcriptional regulator